MSDMKRKHGETVKELEAQIENLQKSKNKSVHALSE